MVSYLFGDWRYPVVVSSGSVWRVSSTLVCSSASCGSLPGDRRGIRCRRRRRRERRPVRGVVVALILWRQAQLVPILGVNPLPDFGRRGWLRSTQAKENRMLVLVTISNRNSQKKIYPPYTFCLHRKLNILMLHYSNLEVINIYDIQDLVTINYYTCTY